MRPSSVSLSPLVPTSGGLLYGDQSDRDRIAEQLLRRRRSGAMDLAHFLVHLSMDEARRRVVRLLGEIEAGG